MRSLDDMHLVVDAHNDIAWNMLRFQRDYTRSAAETRRLEQGTATIRENGDTLLGYADYRRGNVALVFATLFAAPQRASVGKQDTLCYSDLSEAHRLYRRQVDLYHELEASHPEKFRLIRSAGDLESHVRQWGHGEEPPTPVGLILLMEGADGIRSVDELPEWHERGVRVIGLSWAGTRYAGGTREPGPLTDDGRQLLQAMAELRVILDLSHMDAQAAYEAVDQFDGAIVATHVNCLSLLPGFENNRHFDDSLMRAIIGRNGIIGSVPANSFLKSGWKRSSGSRREEVPLETYVDHIDHVCQLAGDSLHAGIGTDFDGGFGLQSVPAGLDTVADLQQLDGLLKGRGYSDDDVANILGLNWLRCLRANLPA